MLIPSQVIMTYVRPSIWLSSMEIGWGILTGLMALVQNAQQAYVIRFFVGLFESGAWPGMMTLLSEYPLCILNRRREPLLTPRKVYWYTPAELTTRMGIYHSARSVGGMMSGALQVAILNTLDGSRGITGWRYANTEYLDPRVNRINT